MPSSLAAQQVPPDYLLVHHCVPLLPSVQVHMFSHRVQQAQCQVPGTRASLPQLQCFNVKHQSMLQDATTPHTRAVQHDGHPQHQAASGTCAASSHQRLVSADACYLAVHSTASAPHKVRAGVLLPGCAQHPTHCKPTASPPAPAAGASGLKTTPHQSLRPWSTQHKPWPLSPAHLCLPCGCRHLKLVDPAHKTADIDAGECLPDELLGLALARHHLAAIH